MVDPCVSMGGDLSQSSLEEREYLPWLALARVNGLGNAGCKKVVEYCGDPRSVLSASEGELPEVTGLEKEAIEGIRAFLGWDEAAAELRRVSEGGSKIIPFHHHLYPVRLRMIPDPPPVLYVKGEIHDKDQQSIAVVGSRSASDYGLRMTQNLSLGLASLGFTVVSGMARGIDGKAHEAALEGGGRTLAVLGSGVDVAYPLEHRELYNRICNKGAVLSELPMGTQPFPFNFPSRNRLISGISLGVMVVEATERSGSLITARLALDQGREVFAVPGEAGASRSRGTHQLIRQGAKLVERVEDVVEEIALQLLSLIGGLKKTARCTLPADSSPEAKKVYELVQQGTMQIDEVIQASGLSPAKVSEILLDLEIKGLLAQLPGKKSTVN